VITPEEGGAWNWKRRMAWAAVIASSILLLIAFVGIPQWRKGQRVVCINQLKHLGLAMRIYEDQEGSFPDSFHALLHTGVMGAEQVSLFRCPLSGESYVWVFPSRDIYDGPSPSLQFLLSDPQACHEDRRNVLCVDGSTKSWPEASFQRELVNQKTACSPERMAQYREECRVSALCSKRLQTLRAAIRSYGKKLPGACPLGPEDLKPYLPDPADLICPHTEKSFEWFGPSETLQDFPEPLLLLKCSGSWTVLRSDGSTAEFTDYPLRKGGRFSEALFREALEKQRRAIQDFREKEGRAP